MPTYKVLVSKLLTCTGMTLAGMAIVLLSGWAGACHKRGGEWSTEVMYCRDRSPEVLYIIIYGSIVHIQERSRDAVVLVFMHNARV